MRNLKYYLPGSILILIAIMIVAVPEILLAFVAASIIAVGIGALCIGHHIRRSGIGFRNIDRRPLDDDFYGWRLLSEPVVRRWYRS